MVGIQSNAQHVNPAADLNVRLLEDNMRICLYPGCRNSVKNNYHEGYCSNRCNEKGTLDLAEEFFVKEKRNLTSRRSRAAKACPKCGKPLIKGVFCETECGHYPPPA